MALISKTTTRRTITRELTAAGFKDIHWTCPDTVTSAARRRPTMRSVVEETGAYCPVAGIENGRCFAQVWVSLAKGEALPP
jgi:hypothetical protein